MTPSAGQGAFARLVHVLTTAPLASPFAPSFLHRRSPVPHRASVRAKACA